MCVGREGAAGCDETTSSTSRFAPPGQSPAQWIIYTLGLWIFLLFIIVIVRTCTDRSRRQKILNRTINPILVKMGFRGITGPPEVDSDTREAGFTGDAAVHYSSRTGLRFPRLSSWSQNLDVFCVSDGSGPPYSSFHFGGPYGFPPPSYDESIAFGHAVLLPSPHHTEPTTAETDDGNTETGGGNAETVGGNAQNDDGNTETTDVNTSGAQQEQSGLER